PLFPNNNQPEPVYQAASTSLNHFDNENNAAQLNPLALPTDSSFAESDSSQPLVATSMTEQLITPETTTSPIVTPLVTMSSDVFQSETTWENPLALPIERQSETQIAQTPPRQIAVSSAVEPTPTEQPMVLSEQSENAWVRQNAAQQPTATQSDAAASLSLAGQSQPRAVMPYLQPIAASQNTIESTPRTLANNNSINTLNQSNNTALLTATESTQKNDVMVVSPTQQAIAMPTATQMPPMTNAATTATSSAPLVIVPPNAVSQNPTIQTQTASEITSYPNNYSAANNYLPVSAQTDVPTAAYAAQVLPQQPQTTLATRNYIVKEGDSIFTIAKHELNNVRRFREIYELNRDRISLQKTTLTAGTVLLLPESSHISSPAESGNGNLAF
ncbi:MAG: hypothetical protein LBJ67_05140, partial [Planctomycetaceae bacterium]|nr:hypothetical protein [Planctomycetaceae bacterium]